MTSTVIEASKLILRTKKMLINKALLRKLEKQVSNYFK